MVHMVQNKDNIDLEAVLLLLRDENHLRGIAKQLNEPVYFIEFIKQPN